MVAFVDGAAAALLAASGPEVVARLEPAAVERVVDGDTLYLSGQPVRLRLFGVDAPERDEQGFEEARDALEYLVKGQVLRCDVLTVDRYGRPVARCFLPDGREVNREMARSAHAREYCRYSNGLYGGCPAAP